MGDMLCVALERPMYHPGDVVQGVVCLRLAQPITTTGIYLKLKVGPGECELAGRVGRGTSRCGLGWGPKQVVAHATP